MSISCLAVHGTVLEHLIGVLSVLYISKADNLTNQRTVKMPFCLCICSKRSQNLEKNAFDAQCPSHLKSLMNGLCRWVVEGSHLSLKSSRKCKNRGFDARRSAHNDTNQYTNVSLKNNL